MNKSLYGPPDEDFYVICARDMLVNEGHVYDINDGFRAKTAENIAELNDAAYTKSILFYVLSHPATPPIVQEGAIYGLEKHMDEEIYYFFENLLVTEPLTENKLSQGVREALEEAIEDYKENQKLEP